MHGNIYANLGIPYVGLCVHLRYLLTIPINFMRFLTWTRTAKLNPTFLIYCDYVYFKFIWADPCWDKRSHYR